MDPSSAAAHLSPVRLALRGRSDVVVGGVVHAPGRHPRHVGFPGARRADGRASALAARPQLVVRYPGPLRRLEHAGRHQEACPQGAVITGSSGSMDTSSADGYILLQALGSLVVRFSALEEFLRDAIVMASGSRNPAVRILTSRLPFKT